MSVLKIWNHPYMITSFRWVLGIMFIYTGLPKIYDPDTFMAAVQNYDILPAASAQILAAVLPWAELIAGLLLITNFWVRLGAIMISGMLCMFIIAIGSLIIRGIHIDCGCQLPDAVTFFNHARLNLMVRFFEDIVFLGMSVSILKFNHCRKNQNNGAC